MEPSIRWGVPQARATLMIPGPTELPWPVIQAMNQPPIIQYDQHFDAKILEPVTLGLRDVFQAPTGEVIVMPGSGRTALESSALSAIEPGDRVIVIIAGVFGSLMREIMIRAGAEVTEFAVEWGQPLDLARLARELDRVKPKAVTLVHNETSTGTTYPAAEVGRLVKRHNALFMLDTVSSLAGLDVRTDEWGVDFNMTGSQKCLAAPLGMAIVSVSPAAWESMERRKHKATSWSYDLLRWKENWVPTSRGGHVADGAPRRQPVSIPTHLTQALGAAVTLIREEGLPHRFRRHAIAGRAFRAGLDAMRLQMFPDPSLLSDTVSCFRTPAGIDPAAVVQHMRDHYGILIGTGLDKMRTSTLRVGHMGITSSPLYVLPTLSALEMTLRDLGHRTEAGAGVAAAQASFADPTA
ncbi:MAG TPA: alanine--glyoxylate aminotransferase family protein [Methylomirabilota bacterium]|jgi:aspartate aminotransferase-like enzyme|nr:alanine--glyoxylate aminotransferase family protein [Methylomirabilota bacterium]